MASENRAAGRIHKLVTNAKDVAVVVEFGLVEEFNSHLIKTGAEIGKLLAAGGAVDGHLCLFSSDGLLGAHF